MFLAPSHTNSWVIIVGLWCAHRNLFVLLSFLKILYNKLFFTLLSDYLVFCLLDQGNGGLLALRKFHGKYFSLLYFYIDWLFFNFFFLCTEIRFMFFKGFDIVFYHLYTPLFNFQTFNLFLTHCFLMVT